MIGTAFILLLLVACHEAIDQDGQATPLRLALIDPVLQWQGDRLGVIAGIDFQPSQAVLEALDHGVPVTLVVATRVHPVHAVLASSDQTRNHRYEIRYLPLTEHYQLTELKTETVTSYPRLRLLIQALAQSRFLDTQLIQSDVSDRTWHLQSRADIDRERLPAPMQLSVWSDPMWQSQSDWFDWRVDMDSDE